MRKLIRSCTEGSASPKAGADRRCRGRWLWLAFVTGAWCATAGAADWYAAPGGNDANDCATPATSCTIQGAIDRAGQNDTVYVAPGQYTFTGNRIRIEGPGKNGLKLVGQTSPFRLPYDEDPEPDISVAPGTPDNRADDAAVLKAATSAVSSGANGMIWVRGARDVRIENLYIEVDASGPFDLGCFCYRQRSKEGVIATGDVNGLSIVNNYFKVVAGSGVIVIGVSVAGTTDSSAPSDEPRGAGNFVHIEGNVIEPSSSAVPKRAIALQNAVGIIRGNQLAATTQDLWFQGPTVVTSNPPEQRVLRIEDNWFFGRLQLYLPAASNVQEPVRIRGNRFIYPGSSFSPPGLPSGISSLLGNGSEAHSVRIMAAQSQPTLVEDNRFLGFRANYRALWVMSRAGVVVQDNDFIPDAGQSDFTAVLVGNRQVWNGLPAPTPYGVTFLRNRFHANGAALNNKAKAIVFVNDNDPSGAAPGGPLQIGDGTQANANHFDAGIRWYIALDDRTCNAQNHNSGTGSGCMGASNTPHPLGEAVAYSGGSNQSSQKRPFRWDVDAPGNVYGGVFMGDVDLAQFEATRARTYARHNRYVTTADVGEIHFGWTPPPVTDGTISLVQPVFTWTGSPHVLEATLAEDGAATCTVDPPTVTDVGTYSVDVHCVSAVDADPRYDVSATLDVVVEKAGQSIGGFSATPADPVYSNGGTFNVTATPGPSSAPVVYGSLTPPVCTVDADTGQVWMHRAGLCRLTASQDGDAHYLPAPQQVLDVQIAKGTGTVAWGDLDFGYTGAPHSVTATVAGDPDGSCTVLPPAVGPAVGMYEVQAVACASERFDVALPVAATATIGGDGIVRRPRDEAYFPSVAAALADPGTQDGDVIELAPGTHAAPIVLTRAVHLAGSSGYTPRAAGTTTPPAVVIDGGNTVANGVVVAANVTGASITGLEVRNVTQNCIHATQGNHGLVVEDNLVHDCGQHGIHVNGIGTIDNVVIRHNEVHNVGYGPNGGRGIVVWNGAKRDITIEENWVHDIAGCCGIELQDGTAAGAWLIGNVVENTGDSGMAAIQLTSGSPTGRANIIRDNQVRNPGRFGIEIKIPFGNGRLPGAGSTDDGVILVENNEVDGGGAESLRDRAGIAVIRNGYAASVPGEIDIAQGVVVRNNTVRQFRSSSPDFEGYGIVIEGAGSRAYDNVLEDNDIGLQYQEGNTGDQNTAGSPWFGRGSAVETCVAPGANTFLGNSEDERVVPTGADLVGGVFNTGSGRWYCTIGAAVADAGAGDTLQVREGTYAENVVIDRALTLHGPHHGTPGADASRGNGEAVIAAGSGQALRINADNVVVSGLTFTGLGGEPASVAVASGGNYGGPASHVEIRDNRFAGLHGTAIYTNGPMFVDGWDVHHNLVDGLSSEYPYSGINLWRAANSSIHDNVIRNTPWGGIQLVTGQNISVYANTVEDVAADGINIGPDVDGVSVTGNTVSGAFSEGALVLYGGSTNVEVACNTFQVASGPVFAGMDAGTAAAFGTHAIFHNAVSGGTFANGNPSDLVIGSNWYGAGVPAPAAPAGVLIAGAMTVQPIGHPQCGDNTPDQVEVYAGSGQSAPVDSAFAQPLQARVVDALGGAVPGVVVDFSAPGTGAGAALAPPLAVTDHNGVAATAATANGLAGSYEVTAAAGTLVAVPGFSLTNTMGTAMVTVHDASYTYDGQPHAVGVDTVPAGLEGDVVLVYEAGGITVATCAATDTACGPVDAGVYAVTATIQGNPNYGGSGSGTLTLDRATSSIVFGALSFVYDGSTHTVEAHLADEPGTGCPVTGTVGPDVAGSPYPVVAPACAGVNYEAPAATASAVVTPQPTTLAFGHLVQAYDGSPRSVTVTTAPTPGVAVAVTYDGSPVPPIAVGTYTVEATITDPNFQQVGGNTATLQVVPGTSDIALVINGPVDPVPVGEPAHYAATMIANPALHPGETYAYRLVVSKTGGSHPLALSDIAGMEVWYQGGWVSPADIGLDPAAFFQYDVDGNLVYHFPVGIPGYDAGFPIEDPVWTWNFRFTFADTGVYTASAELVDGVTHVPVAPAVSASVATVVLDAPPPTDIHLVLAGPASAVTVGEWAEYAGTLIADPALHAGELFFVKVRLARNGGVMTPAHLAGMQIYFGGSWIDGNGLTFVQDGDALVYLFPADQLPGGFPITSGAWTWNFRFQFAEADVYTAMAEVIAAAEAANPLPYVYDTAAISTTVVDAPVVVPEMHLLLAGPLDPVELGDAAQYTGTLVANPADVAGRSFFVRIRLAKNGGADLMSAADLAMMELHDGAQWMDATAQLQGVLLQDGNELLYLFPRPALDTGFPVTSPVWSWNFRFTFADTGVYSAQADVVDAADIADVNDPAQVAAATSLAGASLQTTVVATPAIVVDLQGPVVGEAGQPLQYVGHLDADPLPDPFSLYYVAIRLTRNGGTEPMLEGHLARMEFSPDDGHTWLDFTGGLPLVADGNALTYEFPQPLLPDGFPITGPWSWHFRFTYAEAGVYRAEATVVTADASRTPVSNTAFAQTTVFAQVPAIAITLQGPVSGVGVGAPAHYTGTITADPLPDPSAQFIVRVRLGKNGGGVPMTVADLQSAAISADGINWIPAPEVLGELYPDPVDGNYLLYDFPHPAMPGFPITGPWTWHFRFVYASEGTYSAEATVLAYPGGEAVSNTAGVATLVGPGNAHIAIDPASLYAVYDGVPKSVAVGTTPSGLAYTVTYNGSSTPPVDAGSYLVEAGIDPGQGYTGSASATLVIAKATGTVSIAPLAGAFGSTHAVTAMLDQEPAASCAVDGVPAANAPVGSYLVTASCTGLNHVASASALYQVVPAAAGIEVEDTVRQYTGQPQAVTAVTTPAGLAYQVVYEGTGGTAYPPTTVPPSAIGQYLVTATVTEPNHVPASDTALLVIGNGVQFSLAGDTVAVAGSDPETWSHFTATTGNPDGIVLPEALVVDIAIERGGGIDVGDVVLQVEPFGAPGTWVDIPLVPNGDLLIGTFGPYALDPVASSANLRAKVARGGRYSVTAVVAGASSGTVYATATHAVDAAALSLVGSGNTTGRIGEPVESAYALTNSGTTDLGAHMPPPAGENVRGRFTITGPVPLTGASVPGCGDESCTSPDVAVEFFNPVTGSFQRIYNLQSDGSGGLVAHFGALAVGGIPVPAGFSGSFLFRTTLLNHTGTYTVQSQVVGIESGKVYAQAAPHTIAIGTGAAASIELVGGDAGEAVVGGHAYDQGDLVVRVRDAGGNPVPGVAVAFNVHAGANGAGAGFAAPALTDADGLTSVSLSSNTIAGEFTVTAGIGIGAGQSVGFVLRNVAGDASQLHLVSGSGQTAALNLPFALPLVVRVTDAWGNPVAGEAVQFDVPVSGASALLDAFTATTDADGLAQVQATANGLPGFYTVTAAAGTFPGSVDFGLTNTAASPDTLVLVVDDSDEAVVASGSYTLRAMVTGAGTAVPGVSVTFVVEPGSNGAGTTSSSVVALTGISGEATATFAANSIAGTFNVRAVASGTNDDAVPLTNLADVATTLELVSGSPQSTPVDSPFGQPLVVRATDIHGNPIAGEPVQFTASATGASAVLDPADGLVLTGADGRASVLATANGIAGPHAVQALAAFGSTVDFVLENTTGTVTISDIVWTDNGSDHITYDGLPKLATAAGPGGLPVSFTYNGSSTPPVDAGSYLVIARVDDGNVQGSASAMLVIDPAQVDVSLGDLAQVHDGAAHFASVDTTPAGVTGISLQYSQGGVPVAAPIDAGAYDIEVVLANGNYLLGAVTPPDAQLVIAPAPVSVSFGALGHVYDGTPKSATVTTTPAGVAGIALQYSQGGVPMAAPVDAGSYDVEAVLSNPNYTLAGAATAVMVIQPANAAVTLSGLVQVYDGSPRPVTVSTVPAGLPVAVTYDGQSTPPTAVGSYAVLATVTDDNYTGSAEGTLQIVPAGAQVLTLTVNGGATASATVGTAGAFTFTATVVDAHGNTVPGVAVTFAAPAAGAGITPAMAVVSTGADGTASLTADANTVAGTFQVTATAAGIAPAAVSVTNLADVASMLEVVSGTPQSATVGTDFGDLVVRASDVHGNPVAGVTVTFTAPASGASAVLDPADGVVVTAADGMASVGATANGVAGAYGVTATADGIADVVAFALENLAGGSTVIVKVAGDGQTVPAGTAVPVPPQVRVEDGSGNPVEGAVVQFTVTAGGGSVSGAVVATDAGGLAAVGGWTLGAAGGSNELTASVVGSTVTPVVFSATAVAQVDAAVEVMALGSHTRVGAVHEHLVVVRNDGISPATGVQVEVPLPAGHDAATAQWLCLPSGGAVCPAMSGSGAISTGVDLPAGASVTFLTSALVAGAPADDLITVEAAVQAVGDGDPANDTASATTVVVLFRDGFEPGGDGASGDGPELVAVAGELRLDAEPLTLDAAGARRGAPAWPATWLRLETAQGRAVARIDRLVHGGGTWVRLLGLSTPVQHAGAWMLVQEGIGLALARHGGSAMLLLDAGAASDGLGVPAEAAGGLLVLELGD